MSSLLTALNGNVNSAVWVYLSSGTTLNGTLTSVASDLTVVTGASNTFTIDSTKIVAYAV